MSNGAWATIGVIAGPVLLFLTYLLSRRQQTGTFMADIMTAQVQSALSTTETMKSLLAPLEKEISDLRLEIQILRNHINTLEQQITDLGANPPPAPPTIQY